MMLATLESTPLITVANELVVVLRVFEVTALDVANFPFTFDVNILPLEVSVFVVLEATILESDVVATTPFIVEDSTIPEVDSEFELIIEVDEATPFTEEVTVLADEDTPFDDMTLEVAVTPFIVVVKVLPEID